MHNDRALVNNMYRDKANKSISYYYTTTASKLGGTSVRQFQSFREVNLDQKLGDSNCLNNEDVVD